MSRLEMESDGPDDETFLQIAYRNRSWRDFVLVVGLGAIGGTITFLTIRSICRLRHLSELLTDLPGAIFGSVFFAFGIWACYQSASTFRKAITGEETLVRIDTRGIQHGQSEWKWEQVTFIDSVSAGVGQGVWLRIGIRGRADCGLPTGKPLREHEYVGLLNSLSPFLEKNYPNIRLG